MRLIFRLGTLFGTTLLCTIFIYYYAEPINSFLQNPVASQILLIVLILVDVIGVGITPWLESQIQDTRECNRRLTEDCIAKLQLDPSADDEHILTIPSSSSEGYANLSPQAKMGIKPPYYEEMIARLQNYPKIWKLVQELPKLYRNTKGTLDSLINKIRKELESIVITENFAPTPRQKYEISLLADQVCGDIMNKRAPMKYQVKQDKNDGNVSVAGTCIAFSFSEAEMLADKMTKLAENPLYKKECETIKKNSDYVLQKTSEFPKERDVIVEEIRLSNYKNLKRTPWWKRLDC